MRNRIRALRSERELSQGQLATAVCVSRQTINSIEQGRYTPSLPLAIRLARYFDSTFVVQIARGHNGDPYTWLASLGGASYIGAILFMRGSR